MGTSIKDMFDLNFDKYMFVVCTDLLHVDIEVSRLSVNRLKIYVLEMQVKKIVINDD